MNAVIPIKRLYKIAAYTSTAIGIITMGPVYIIGITIANIETSYTTLIKLLGSSALGISLFVFLLWVFNISLLKIAHRKTHLFRREKVRYFWSYFLCFSIFFTLRLLGIPLLNNPEKLNEILEWKTNAFGLRPGNFDLMQFNNFGFQVLILAFVIFSVNTVVLIIQELVVLLEKKTKIENENIALKIKNIEAANQKLKQQLQPHFLFNSLNVLKTLVKKQPDDAGTYIKRLSDFLRASVSLDKVNTVTFEEELKLSLDYIVKPGTSL